MILSSLVKDDPRSFIDLDKNLARYVGAENVEAFHEEAGNLVVDELVDNPKLFNRLLSDEAVVAELGAAVQRVSAKAFGRPMTALGSNHRETAKALLQATTTRDSNMMRDLIQGELLTNGLINDRTMRSPEIMEVLNDRVQELFKSRRIKKPRG